MIQEMRDAILANSQAKTKLHELQLQDTPDEGALAAAHTEYRESEEALRTAVVKDDSEPEVVVEDTEYREKLRIRDRANLGRYIAAAVEGGRVSGAEKDLAAAFNCAEGFMPICMFNDEPTATELREAATEYRAITPVPGTDVQGSRAAVVPAPFERSALAALGVTFPTVPQGVPVYPSLTTAPPAGIKSKGTAVDSTAAAFDLVVRKPRRIGGRVSMAAENLAVLPSMAQTLREGLVDAAADAIDKAGFSTGTADTDGNIAGLFGVATDVTADTTTATFSNFVSKLAGMVDGKYAYGWGDMRLVVGSDTFARLAGQFQSNGDMSVWDYLVGKLASVRVSNRVPAKTGSTQKGILTRNALRQRIKIPVWGGIKLLTDELSDSDKGEIHVTAYALVGSPVVPYTTDMVKEIHPKIT